MRPAELAARVPHIERKRRMTHGRVRGRCSGLTRAHHNRYETGRDSCESPLGTHRPSTLSRWIRRIKTNSILIFIFVFADRMVEVIDTVEAAEKVSEWLHAVPWEAVASLASDLLPPIVELLIWILLLL